MLMLRRAAPACLILLYVWMAVSVSRQQGATVDEVPHITAGVTYWKTSDFRLQPENGNLPQRWVALPHAASQVQLPAMDTPAWQVADVWTFGHAFFFQVGNDPARLLFASRFMIALLGAGVTAIVFFWSRSLFGWMGGVCSLLLAAFCPHLLAHGGLATSDMAAALGFSAALLTWWRLCHRVTVARLAVTGGAFGLLALAKFSAALFVPIGVILAVVRLCHSAPLLLSLGTRRWRVRGLARVPVLAGSGIIAAGLAAGVIWAAFGFRYSPQPGTGPAVFAKTWDDLLLTDPRPDFPLADGSSAIDASVNLAPGPVQRFVTLARRHQLLPEPYLYGLAFVDRHARARLAFFAGEFRTSGWWNFFPTAFALKTTLPAMVVLLLAAVGVARRRPVRGKLYRTLPLLALLVVYWAFSISSTLNIGHRHLLPIYPVLYVLGGAVGAWVAGRRVALATVGMLLGWHIFESASIRPHYLSYFNQIAGGPRNAHRYFVDSSLDWGQDLPALKSWIDEHAGAEKIYLSYFGSDSPAHRGIAATRIADNYFDAEPRRALPVMSGGLYCISATMFRRVYTRVRGPWTADYERVYWELVRWLKFLNEQPKGSVPGDLGNRALAEAEFQQRLLLLEQMRFGRLCHYLRNRDPDAFAGYSILIFRLSSDEIAFALGATLETLEAHAAERKIPVSHRE